MNDVPRDEAEALLRIPSICPDAIPWQPQARGLPRWTAGAGLLDQDGNPRGLTTDMLVTQGTGKLGMMKYQFTVYRYAQGTPQRVYQLDVPKWPRVPRDLHQLPHEHIGNSRSPGDASWIAWSYDDALRHFCQRTNIHFEPALPDPFDFRLTPG